MMKKTLWTLLFFHACAFAQQTQELRGVWITNVDSDILTSNQKIAQGMDYLSSIGINVIFPVVWNAGYTLYPSEIMKDLIGIEIFPHASYNNRDPLHRLVIEAHRNGIEVVPWFEYGLAVKYSTAAGQVGEILEAKPQWASKNANGKITTNLSGGALPSFLWMSGLNPDVQNFMISLIMETVRNYDLDGIQGDDRLPALPYEGGYDSTTVALYQQEHGGFSPPALHTDQSWIRWRANKLNDFMKRIRDSVKSVASNLIVSSGPSEYAWGFPSLLQDSKTWLDSGYIDNLIPQLYPDANERTTPTGASAAYQFRLNRALNYVQPNMKERFFGGVLSKVGSYVADPGTLIKNVEYNRSKGIKGETYFFYEGIANVNRKNGDSLHATVYSSDALLPYRNGKRWRPKAVIVNNEDSAQVSFVGAWFKNQSPGFVEKILVAPDTGYSSITYSMEVPKSGYYDIYSYVVGISAYSKKAPYTIFGKDSTYTVTIDQSLTTQTGWQYLGTSYLDAGMKNVVQQTNQSIDAPVVMTDAMMIMINRKLSPEVDFTTSIDVKEQHSPGKYLLGQNYPNPFNPSTVIQYYVPEHSNVKLTLYDVVGREVAVLQESELTPGFHSYNLNADERHLSSGVYFYSLRTGYSYEMKKAVFIK